MRQPRRCRRRRRSADIPIPVDDAPPLAPDAGRAPLRRDRRIDSGPPDIESSAARRARAAARSGANRLRLPLPLAIVALVALVRGAARLAQGHRAACAAARIVLWCDRDAGQPARPAFTDVKIGNEIHDGVPVLVVEGMIVSTVSMPVEVPRLRFALRNATRGRGLFLDRAAVAAGAASL